MASKSSLFWVIISVVVVVIAGVTFYIGLNTSGNNTTKGIGNVSDIEVRALYEGTVQVPEIAFYGIARDTTLKRYTASIGKHLTLVLFCRSVIEK